MLSRRDLVGKIAACSAAILATGVARTSSASTNKEASKIFGAGLNDHRAGPTAETPAAAEASVMQRVIAADATDAAAPAAVGEPAPWQLLHPLTVGSGVAHGWRVADLSSVMDGSCVLTLQNERGRTHRVHLCRNDGRPQGLVYTDRLDLLVMNGGQGDLPTDEGLAQAIAEVAHVLAANEDKRQQQPVVVALMPHAERLRLYADAENARLR